MQKFEPSGFRRNTSLPVGPSYDEAYVDANGHRPGEKGFVQPMRAMSRRHLTAAAAPDLGPGDYDASYTDANGRRPGPSTGHVTSHVDPRVVRSHFGNSRWRCSVVFFIGDLGASRHSDFTSPGLTASPLHGGPCPCAGDSGFVTPAGVVCPTGYDEHYVDAAGRRPGDAGFVPPCYSVDYRDAEGRRPGERGFVPPAHGLCHHPQPLAAGEYDDNYRDAEGHTQAFPHQS